MNILRGFSGFSILDFMYWFLRTPNEWLCSEDNPNRPDFCLDD